MNKYDYIIIGAGPSGMTAAITLKRNNPNYRILLLEKNEAIGKKLRATGNGRCNISNANAEHSDEVIEFLTSIGLATRIYENGLVYPYSESAADVVDLFDLRLTEAGVEIKCNSNVSLIKQTAEEADGGFEVSVDNNRYYSTKLILSCGGKAGSQFGTIGDGYRFAREFGHTVVRTVPALTSVECEYQDLEQIAGVRARGLVRLLLDNKELFSEEGEIQFTKYGLSGICVFNMTRYMRLDRNNIDGLDRFRISIDLFPGDAASKFGSRGILKRKLADYLETHGGDIHNLEFKPTGLKGWKDAQVTSGGVSLDELDAATCESKLVAGLYIIGELADYDGPCGGYNINNAIYTGLKVVGTKVAGGANNG